MSWLSFTGFRFGPCDLVKLFTPIIFMNSIPEDWLQNQVSITLININNIFVLTCKEAHKH